MEKILIDFNEWLKSNCYMVTFTKEECIEKEISTIDNICWLYISDGKRYTSKEITKIYLNKI